MSEDLKDQIEQVREYARRQVALGSLRSVAKEVGISHTALAGFVREESPREPYGIGRRRLLEWGMARGVIPTAYLGGWRKIGDLAREAVAQIGTEKKVSKEALDRVRLYLKRLNAAHVGEVRLITAESLMLSNPFEQLRDSRGRRRTTEDELADIDRAFRYACEVLEDEGFDLTINPDENGPEPGPDDLSRAFDEGEAEAELLARAQQPRPQKPAKKRRHG